MTRFPWWVHWLGGMMLVTFAWLHWSSVQERRYDALWDLCESRRAEMRARVQYEQGRVQDARERVNFSMSDDDAVLLYYTLQAHLRQAGKIDAGVECVAMAGGAQ